MPRFDVLARRGASIIFKTSNWRPWSLRRFRIDPTGLQLVSEVCTARQSSTDDLERYHWSPICSTSWVWYLSTVHSSVTTQAPEGAGTMCRTLEVVLPMINEGRAASTKVIWSTIIRYLRQQKPSHRAIANYVSHQICWLRWGHWGSWGFRAKSIT